jgi:hypothetical protein
MWFICGTFSEPVALVAHAQGVDVALAAFGVGKGSAKMPEEEMRKIEIAYPQALCRAAKAGGARVCGVMTAAGADNQAGIKYAKIIGEKEKAVESVKFDFLGVYRPAVGNSNTPCVLGYVSRSTALYSTARRAGPDSRENRMNLLRSRKTTGNIVSTKVDGSGTVEAEATLNVPVAPGPEK